MRLAEKRDDMTDDVAPVSKVPAADAEGSGSPPAASLTADLIQRRQDSSRGAPADPPEHQATPEVSEVLDDEPAGARVQQAILEKAFAEPEPVEALPPIERSEFQSARDSAAHWSLRGGPSAAFWDRVIKDVSIFTIFFAVLVFVILQTM